MSMTTALTGLNAAQADLSATSNNIANIGTVGYRGSRAEFADVYSASPFDVSRTTVGSGAQLTRIAQDFSQGGVVATGNRLDLAIEGPGFFALRPVSPDPGVTAGTVFSRAGAFTMSDDGTIVNASGQQLLGWPVAGDGQALTRAIDMATPLQIPLTMGIPTATTEVALGLRLPSDPAMAGGQTAVPPAAAFDAADSTTWAHRTAVPVIDEMGNAVEAEAYFVRTANPTGTPPETEYEVHLVRDGEELTATGGATLTLGADGLPVAGTVPLEFTGTAGDLALDLGGTMLTDAAFSVASVTQDGVTPAGLSAIDIDSTGTLWASYGLDNTVAIGKMMLADFASPQGLRPTGGTGFAATATSGDPSVGTAGATGLGLVRSGALEKANIDLTDQLVNLISAQRNYQANAKAFETSSTLMQTIININ